MARSERTEIELNKDINAAIAGTEEEIFADALDAEVDEGDEGDTELEEQGEGLEGDDLDEEDIEDADEDEADEDEEAEEDEEPSEDEDETEEEDEEPEQPRDARGRFDRDQPRIPPERLRQTSERARQAEQREREIQQRYEILEARFNDMQQRLNSPPQRPQEQPAAPAKPDMFVDPDGYEKWMLERAEERAQANVQRAFAQREEYQRQQFNQRAEASLAAAERGERGFEFRAAYNQLLTLNPQDPRARAVVQGIVYSPDPASALFDWWDQNGGQEYREQLFSQLSGRGAPRRGREERRAYREDREPRHVVRRAQPMRSLNSASGSSSHRVSDPEMLDGSDGSVFDYATKR